MHIPPQEISFNDTEGEDEDYADTGDIQSALLYSNRALAINQTCPSYEASAGPGCTRTPVVRISRIRRRSAHNAFLSLRVTAQA